MYSKHPGRYPKKLRAYTLLKSTLEDPWSQSISRPEQVPIVQGAVKGRSNSGHDRAIKAFASQDVAIIWILSCVTSAGWAWIAWARPLVDRKRATTTTTCGREGQQQRAHLLDMPVKMPGVLRGKRHRVKGGWGYVGGKLQPGNLAGKTHCILLLDTPSNRRHVRCLASKHDAVLI